MKQFESVCNRGTSTIRNFSHAVEAFTMIYVVELSHALQSSIHIVIQQAITIAAVAKCLPPREAHALACNGNVLCNMETIRASHWRHRVEVHTYYHIGIISKQRHKVVVYLILLILKLVELVELECKVFVVHRICHRIVCASVNRATAIHKQSALEGVLVLLVCVDCYVEVALYLLVLTERNLCPFVIVEEVRQLRLQRIKHFGSCRFDLRMINRHTSLKLLCIHH